MDNPVVHFEILGPDGAQLIDFYRDVFGWPLQDSHGPHKSDRYLGTQPLFAACGFDVLDRPSPRRVVMRRELSA